MKRKKNKGNTIHFDISVNGECFPVKATSYLNNNEERRFRVSYNGSPVIIFAWDTRENKMVKSDSTHIPFTVENEIANELGLRMVA